MSSRPAWSTELFPGQAPKPQRNPVSKNQKKKKKWVPTSMIGTCDIIRVRLVLVSV